MKRTINLTIVLTLITIAMLFNACNSGQPKDNRTDLLASANELDSLFLVAFNSGDADAIMKLHWNSPELNAYPPGEMQVSGYDKVKESYTRDFATNKAAKLEYTDAHNMVFNDVVVGYGTFKWTMPMEGGAPMEFNGRYSEVKAMKDGKLVILLDHTSVPMTPPAEEMPTDTTKVK
ncbi:MAG: nuclear transport factor 2 family protein [Saprospiraceae bacterium]